MKRNFKEILEEFLVIENDIDGIRVDIKVNDELVFIYVNERGSTISTIVEKGSKTQEKLVELGYKNGASYTCEITCLLRIHMTKEFNYSKKFIVDEIKRLKDFVFRERVKENV